MSRRLGEKAARSESPMWESAIEVLKSNVFNKGLSFSVSYFNFVSPSAICEFGIFSRKSLRVALLLVALALNVREDISSPDFSFNDSFLRCRFRESCVSL